MLSQESINNIPHGIALRLRQICDSDEKCKHRSEEYKNYLTAMGYYPGLVKNRFKKLKGRRDIMQEREIQKGKRWVRLNL